MIEIAEQEKAIRIKANEWIEEYGAEFLVELIGDFLSDAAQRMEKLRQAVHDADADVMNREAHTLKSSSANLGAGRFSHIAKSIEHLARDRALAAAAAQTVELELVFEQVKQTLESVRSQLLETER